MQSNNKGYHSVELNKERGIEKRSAYQAASSSDRSSPRYEISGLQL